MSIVLVLLIAAPQATEEYVCGGAETYRDCRSTLGATFVERVLGDRIVRKGEDGKGNSWVEYINPDGGGGYRTTGSDSNGVTWSSRCSDAFGTYGTGRDGEPISRPPAPPRKLELDASGKPLPVRSHCLD